MNTLEEFLFPRRYLEYVCIVEKGNTKTFIILRGYVMFLLKTNLLFLLFLGHDDMGKHNIHLLFSPIALQIISFQISFMVLKTYQPSLIFTYSNVVMEKYIEYKI